MMGQFLDQLRFWLKPTPREQGFQWPDEMTSLRMTMVSYDPFTDMLRATWDIIETGVVIKRSDVVMARQVWLNETNLIRLMDEVLYDPNEALL